jgi:hypothetical protein
MGADPWVRRTALKRGINGMIDNDGEGGETRCIVDKLETSLPTG